MSEGGARHTSEPDPRRRSEGGARRTSEPGPRRLSGRGGALVDLTLILGALAAGILVALAVGAANLGVAFGVGQITCILAVVYVLLRR